MSSVLIKGLDLPHNGGYIEIRLHDDRAEVEVQELTFKDFEVAEVPTPHGRLIDADVVKEYGIMAEDYCTDLFVHVDDIDDAPTIIEAEGKGYGNSTTQD